MKHIKRSLSIFLVLCLTLGLLPLSGQVRAEGEYTDRDSYANQWARSDLRIWLNGLTLTAGGVPPLDGSNGSKGTGGATNFLNCFTAEACGRVHLRGYSKPRRSTHAESQQGRR